MNHREKEGSMTREEDVSRKTAVLTEYLKKRGIFAVKFDKVDNFAWITSGARSYVTDGDHFGIASALLTTESLYVISKNPETTRLVNDELPSNVKAIGYPWYGKMDDTVEELIGSKAIVTDEDENLQDFLLKNRVVLSDYEIGNYEDVGKRTARALEKAMKKFTPEMTEIHAKALVEAELIEEDLDVLLVLVFGDESRSLYRHNLVRNVKIGKRCFASVNSKKYGLVVSATRTIEFVKDEKFEEQTEKTIEIETEILDATFTEKTISSVFQRLDDSYRTHGYPDEWHLHHQGGIAGYNSREVFATPDLRFDLENGMAFAWNPTVTGTKSEDTYIRTGNGMKLVSTDEESDWPCIEKTVGGRKYVRPGILKMV